MNDLSTKLVKPECNANCTTSSYRNMWTLVNLNVYECVCMCVCCVYMSTLIVFMHLSALLCVLAQLSVKTQNTYVYVQMALVCLHVICYSCLNKCTTWPMNVFNECVCCKCMSVWVCIDVLVCLQPFFFNFNFYVNQCSYILFCKCTKLLGNSLQFRQCILLPICIAEPHTHWIKCICSFLNYLTNQSDNFFIHVYARTPMLKKNVY